MNKREIIDCLGRSQGARVARYVWRSRPTQDPSLGRPVRCLVAQDEKGRYWAATRIGRGDAQKAQHEFWLEPCGTKQEAMQMSREQTREFLSAEAQILSGSMTDKKPGEKLVEVTMDDGWSVAIHAPGRLHPGERKVMALFECMGKGKPAAGQETKPRRSKDWPSR